MDKRKKMAKILEKFIFPCLLLIYPLLWVNQGIDVSDPMYSLTNFRFFPELKGSWAIATYLANVAGWFLMKLPFGGTLLGISFYTRLLISAMALFSYYFLKGKMPAWVAFTGEIIAVSFCWCPTTILYNYLTYFLFLAVCIFLYRGLIWDRKGLLVWAGVFLGLNVMVRTPNIAEALLIIAVFFYGRLSGKSMQEMWKQTGLCAAGFLAGFLGVFLVICIQYGPGAYFGMFGSLAGYTATDESYSPFSMLTSIFASYGRTMVWLMVIAVCVLAGWIFFHVLPARFRRAGQAAYCLCLPVLIRLLWGRGMFTFTYYNYRSIYEWGMLFLYLVIISCVVCIGNSRFFRRDRLLALIILLSVAALPLGSNNDTMPNLNSLFLAAPFALWMLGKYIRRMRRKPGAFPVIAMSVMVVGMVLIQGIGFRSHFAFGDGIYGEKRDTEIENSHILKGMKTRSRNADQLTGLLEYAGQNGLSGLPLVAFGNAPGLHFLLDMPPGLTHAWPDLDTYPAAQMEEELGQLKEGAVVIIYKENGELPSDSEKMQALTAWLDDKKYIPVYENEGYLIYTDGSDRPAYKLR